MQAQTPFISIIGLAVGAGLLAVFLLWVSKQIANRQTRPQGIAIAALSAGVLVLGLFVARSSVEIEHRPNTLAPPISRSDNPIEHPMSMDLRGRVELGYTYDSAGGVQAAAISQSHPAPAWGKLMILAVVVAVILFASASGKGLAATLAGLGIVAAILIMYLSAAHDVQVVREAARVTPPVAAPVATPAPEPIDPPLGTRDLPRAGDDHGHEHVGPTHSTAEISTSDVKSATGAANGEKATGSSTRQPDVTTAEALESATPPGPPPAWIKSEPTMEDGIYRAAVASGPYSTKRECEAQIDEALRLALIRYSQDHSRPSAQFAVWSDMAYIRSNLIEERYYAEQDHDFGKMYTLHVRFKVDAQDVARFNAIEHHWQTRRAVETASLGGACLLGTLALLYGGLRFAGRKKPAAPAATPDAPAEATA